MGYSRWEDTQYTVYANATNLRSLSREQTFTSRGLPESLNPAKFALRESRDSEANPNSTPIILALDVTGSMGFIAEEIAKDGLPKLMKAIYDDKPVSDPHIMFMGVGDVRANDDAPLQMSQFESDIKLVEQLRTMWLEGGGGANDNESYTLPWYAALTRTTTDAEKRGEKGFLFTMGDELPPPDLSKDHLTRVFGKGQYPEVYETGKLLKDVSEKYHTFHIIAEEGSHCRYNGDRVRSAWAQLMGPTVLLMRDHKALTAIVTAAMRITQGANIHAVIDEGGKFKDDLEHAFKYALQNVA